MNKIISVMNWLTDMDWSWWPLLRCRPAKNEYIDNLVVLKITPFFGTIAGLIPISMMNNFDDLKVVIFFLLFGWVGFFILYRLTFSIAWNIRANSLKNENNSAK